VFQIPRQVSRAKLGDPMSVATGTACLGKYAAPRAGPVLVYLTEDALPVIRERVAGMARHRGLDLAGVEIHVITAPALRLDRDPHLGRLLETARRLRPRLLLLDPQVRLHAIDENRASEVAGLLAHRLRGAAGGRHQDQQDLGRMQTNVAAPFAASDDSRLIDYSFVRLPRLFLLHGFE
jgi:hypothetical protein